MNTDIDIFPARCLEFIRFDLDLIKHPIVLIQMIEKLMSQIFINIFLYFYAKNENFQLNNSKFFYEGYEYGSIINQLHCIISSVFQIDYSIFFFAKKYFII